MRAAARRGARRPGVRGAVRRAAGASGVDAPRDPVGGRRRSRRDRHRPHRARLRRRGLRTGAAHDLAVLGRSTRPAQFYPGYGPLEGLTTREAAEPDHRESLRERGLLVARRDYPPLPGLLALPTPLMFRVVDEWFIAGDEIRQPMLDGERGGRVDAGQYGKRMDDWLRNMGDWNISRKRYFGPAAAVLPVRRAAAERDRLARGAARSGRRRARPARRSSTGPGSTRSTIRCQAVRQRVRRVTEVGDAWLDAGIVPFSTLGWRTRIGGRLRPVQRGPHGADLPHHAYWERGSRPTGSPRCASRSGSGSTRCSFMSVTLDGRSPYRQGAHLREAARRDRPRDAQVAGATRSRRTRRSTGWAPT